MRFHVVGLGAIGTLVAHHLRRVLPSQHPITLFQRNQRQTRVSCRNEGALLVDQDGVTMRQTGYRFEAGPTNPWKPPEGSIAPRLFELVGAREERRQEYFRERPIESLIVCTKAQSTIGVLRKLVHRITPSTTIVLLQNGMGVYERLVDELFEDPFTRPQFILASNTHGAWKRRPLHAVHAGMGRIEFGIVPDPRGRDFERALRDNTTGTRPEHRECRLVDICDPPKDAETERYLPLRNTVSALLALELDARWRPIAEVEIAMRRKLVVNAVINPLSALMGCRNKDVFVHPASFKILRRVCNEANLVFAAQMREESGAWASRDRNDDSASAAVDGDESDVEAVEGNVAATEMLLPPALRKHELVRECIRVATITGENESSMLVDIRSGRDTEIDYINGYLVGLGQEYKVPTPTTSMLCNLIKMRTSIPLDQVY